MPVPNDHGRKAVGMRLALGAFGRAAPYMAWIVIATAFVIDWQVPADVNVVAFYALAVVLSCGSRTPRSVWLAAIVSSVLIFAAVPLGPSSIDPTRPDWVVWLNRGLTCAVLVLLAAIAQGLVRVLDRLSDANQTLETRVAERTREREAALARLHEAQKIEALGQLTQNVAHDFGNLLTIISANLDLLDRRLTDEPKLSRYITAATAGVARAKTLVERLLAFARRQEPIVKLIDLSALIRDLLPLITHAVGKQVAVHLDLPPRVMAWADRDRLELSILNLAVNASDAMPDGGELRIEVSGTAPGFDHVRLAVCDTGTGMDEATRRRALEPLFTTKPAGKGTGLGLSMADNLARQLGGRLELQSCPGQGTRVEFWLRGEAIATPSFAGGQGPQS